MSFVAIGRPGAPASAIPAWVRPVAVFGGGAIVLLILAMIHVSQGAAAIDVGTIIDAIARPRDDALEHQVVRYVRLPRVAIGIVAGAALAVAGALMQAATRNPLASASTLGVNAGAMLAMTITTLLYPGLASSFPILAPFAGGTIAAGLVFILAGGYRATPAKLALAGMALTLAFAAAASAIQLMNEQALGAIFFWGAGSLLEDDWSGVEFALPRVLLGVAAAIAIGRALDILALGDDRARALGMRTSLVRTISFGIAVGLAATTVAVVGPIGFVGIIAPHAVRLAGIHTYRTLIPGAALWGAVVVVGADVVGRYLSGISEVPAGIVTALFGVPWFIWLARQERGGVTASGGNPASTGAGGTRWSYRTMLGGAAALLGIALLAGLVFGDQRVSLVEAIRGGSPLAELAHRIVFEFRLPRLLVAAGAGCLLAISGCLIQGVVRNPLAAPELVGVTSGAGVAALVLLVIFPSVSLAFLPAAAVAGALVAFGITYILSWKDGISPARLALIGIAVSAFGAAIINVLVLRSGLAVAPALVWLSGSTYGRGWSNLEQMLPWLIVLIPIALLTTRWLDLLALGDDVPRALGLPLERVRLFLLLVGAALAAAAVAVVGTVAFVGLVAPHAARMLAGSRNRHVIPLAALLGAVAMVVADTLGRSLFAPNEIPSGLVTTMIGAPYFLYLLWRTPRTA